MTPADVATSCRAMHDHLEAYSRDAFGLMTLDVVGIGKALAAAAVTIEQLAGVKVAVVTQADTVDRSHA